jgi:hypothetical protein
LDWLISVQEYDRSRKTGTRRSSKLDSAISGGLGMELRKIVEGYDQFFEDLEGIEGYEATPVLKYFCPLRTRSEFSNFTPFSSFALSTLLLLPILNFHKL